MIASPKRRKDGGQRSVYPIYFIVTAGQMTHAPELVERIGPLVDNPVRIGEVRPGTTGILVWVGNRSFGNAFSPRLESSGTFYGA
jgi:hypothetical protein